MKPRSISFGDLRIGPTARKYIDRALSKNWISEGDNVAEFESRFAEKFQWKHAISTSSGTDAGIVVWSAIRELNPRIAPHSCLGSISNYRGFILTPACAFVSTASCIFAAGLEPQFVDIDLETLNINPKQIVEIVQRAKGVGHRIIGLQFVATMGKPTPIGQIAAIADEHDLYLVSDSCEAHGARLLGGRQYADHYADASIYSFYCAHLIVGGEGGMICTDDDDIAELCRSIKSHGRPTGQNYFDFKRVGFNSKWNDLCAAIGLEGLEQFDDNFARRRELYAGMLVRLESLKDFLILYRDLPGEIVAPHAFPIVLRDPDADAWVLYQHMTQAGIQVKWLFKSLPTQHDAFKWMGHKLGEFPVAERVGRTGIHFGMHQYLSENDLDYIAEVIEDGLKRYYKR